MQKKNFSTTSFSNVLFIIYNATDYIRMSGFQLRMVITLVYSQKWLDSSNWIPWRFFNQICLCVVWIGLCGLRDIENSLEWKV